MGGRLTMLVLLISAMAGAQRIYPPLPGPPQAAPTPAPAPQASKSPPVPTPKPDPLIAGHDIDVGSFYYRRDDFVGALARFQDAIYNDPTSAEAYCRAGDTEAKLKQTLPARVDWQRCLKEASSGDKWAKHAQQELARNKPA